MVCFSFLLHFFPSRFCHTIGVWSKSRHRCFYNWLFGLWFYYRYLTLLYRLNCYWSRRSLFFFTWHCLVSSTNTFFIKFSFFGFLWFRLIFGLNRGKTLISFFYLFFTKIIIFWLSFRWTEVSHSICWILNFIFGIWRLRQSF